MDIEIDGFRVRTMDSMSLTLDEKKEVKHADGSSTSEWVNMGVYFASVQDSLEWLLRHCEVNADAVGSIDDAISAISEINDKMRSDLERILERIEELVETAKAHRLL